MNIKDYKFKYGMATVKEHCVGGLVIEFPNGTSMLAKEDIIAMAKALKVNVNDLNTD